MKRIFYTLLFACCSMVVSAGDEVYFEFSEGISGSLKVKMEQQLSKFLTAINRAESTGSSEINYNGVLFNSNETASQTIGMLWNSVHFRTQDDDFYETCLRRRQGNKMTGYQVRNIYMEMKPIDDSYQENPVQEFVIDFDDQGRISDVNIAIEKLQYQSLLNSREALKDMDKVEQIISFCEQFANAYHKMDLAYMQDIFSDDALIITGRVRQREKATVSLVNREVNLPKQNDVDYIVQTKDQYLNKLAECFNRQKNMPGGYINVKFEDYSIVRHPDPKKNYYGVTLKQSWYSKGYNDEGIVFIVWNFSDENRPKIEVRTWQAMNTDEKDIFNLNDITLRDN